MSHTSNSTTKLCGVYAIICKPSGKLYIGSAVDIKRRWSWHRTALRRGKHHSVLLQRAWDKYGEGQFEFRVIEISQVGKHIAREQHWIDAVKSYVPKCGFNIARNARHPTVGKRLTAEHRAKIGAASLGRRRTEAEKAKISAAHKGRKHTDRARANMSAAHKGYKHTPEQRAKIGEASKANWQRPEYQNAIREKRRNISNETRAKLSAALTGRPCSAETKDKIGDANSKSFIATSPEGVEYHFKNLAKFCREHGLRSAGMSRVATGQRSHTMGWKCRHV